MAQRGYQRCRRDSGGGTSPCWGCIRSTVSVQNRLPRLATQVWGALRGLETFSQMVIFDFDAEVHTLPLAPWAVRDEPRFAHRGLMMDTSRHFEPLSAIKRLITSLSFAKLNTLHCEYGT